jgi:hypothetical protein
MPPGVIIAARDGDGVAAQGMSKGDRRVPPARIKVPRGSRAARSPRVPPLETIDPSSGTMKIAAGCALSRRAALLIGPPPRAAHFDAARRRRRSTGRSDGIFAAASNVRISPWEPHDRGRLAGRRSAVGRITCSNCSAVELGKRLIPFLLAKLKAKPDHLAA